MGVVHFDAHADTAPEIQGVLASHGAPIPRLIESGAVRGRNFMEVGLRGYYVVDPSAAPATGSPEPGGHTSCEILRAVRRLSAEVGIVGIDLVEVSPPCDAGNNITCILAHRCVLEALTGIAMRRLWMTSPNYLDPTLAVAGRRSEE